MLDEALEIMLDREAGGEVCFGDDFDDLEDEEEDEDEEDEDEEEGGGPDKKRPKV